MTGYAAPAKTLDNLQTLKGLACILVVAYHVVGGLNLPASSPMAKFSEAMALLRMPLFTFLSGYVYALRPVEFGGYWQFLRRKLARLYVPIVAVGVLFFTVALYAPGVNSRPAAGAVLDLLVYPYAHFWFVQALIVILGVVGLAEIFGLLVTPFRYSAMLCLAVLVQLFGATDIEFFSIARAGYLLPFFLLGVGVRRYAGKLQWNEGFVLLSMLLFAAMLATHIAGILGWYGAPLEARTFAATMLSASGLLVLAKFVRRSNALDSIGEYAFAIYLFHVFFTAGMRAVLVSSGVQSVALQVALGLFVGIAGPIALERVVNRMPRYVPLTLLGAAPERPARG